MRIYIIMPDALDIGFYVLTQIQDRCCLQSVHDCNALIKYEWHHVPVSSGTCDFRVRCSGVVLMLGAFCVLQWGLPLCLPGNGPGCYLRKAPPENEHRSDTRAMALGSKHNI